MEKNKGLFSFREHPVGNFSERKKGRKRQGGRLRRSIGFLLAAALIFNTMPANGLTVSASGREAGLCKHHQEHDADCGYISKSEDGEGSPCTYKCRICPVENLIAALPDKGTKRNEFRLDNAEDVRAQLEEILALYRELNEDEQEQIDLSRCYELQAALDGANAPDPVTESVEYQEASWNDGVTYTTETADSCTPVADSADAVTWDAGWYVVNGTVTISEPITVTGAVNLILADGCTLTAGKSIVVETGNSLTIYAQSGGTGTLNATGTADSDHNASAGIGGSETAPDSGTITIHGGEIKATGGGQSRYRSGAGIGGGAVRNGNGGNSGAITIYGGTITANSGEGNVTGAGIGGGASGNNNNGGSGNDITIYGGSVTAASTGTSTGGAGIGGGGGTTGGGAGEYIKIYGGTVKATGGNLGAGIGGGGSGIGQNPDSSLYQSGNGTGITISGGTVTAIGGKYAAGIGGGGGYYFSSSYGGSSGCTGGTCSVTISGGIVDAKGGAGNSSGDYAGDPIGNGGNAGDTVATVNKTNGIVFENGAGTVCSAVTLDGSYTVPGDYMLNIPAGASLSGSGTLSGGSAFTTENLTEDMISVPTDLYYTGEDRSEDITTRLSDELTKGVTICGQTFAVSGWTLAVEKTDDLTYTATYTNNNDNTNTFTKTITLLKSGTKFEGDVKTYNGDTQTTTFNADDTITVKATPTATGTAPAKAAVRLRGSYTAPTAGQMALFVGDVQVSAPVEAGTDGTYTMEVSAAEVLLQGNAEQNGNAITLTAKFVGNDNMADAAGTVDVRISAVAMAEKDGEVIGYFGVSDFEGTNNLFFQNAYTNATITLLRDVQPGTNSDAGTTCSTMVNITCTLDLTGHKFTSTDTAIFVLPGGNLTIQDSSTGKTGNVSFIKSDGTLTLYGGTFGKIETAYTLSSLLAENCAYYRGSTPIPLSELEGQKTLDGTVTVQECDHTGVEVKDLGNGKHGLDCPYCGYHSEHTTTLTATASGNTVTLNGGCGTEGCGYQTTLGTASFTFPKVTYGQSGDVTCAWDGPTGYYGLIEVIGGSQSQFEKNADEDIAERSWTLAQLFGRTKVTAGKHKLKVSFATDVRSNECELDFTIDPAPLTADMVTLSAESATYSGTEQKPTLSVQQGETTLNEGTDYEVSYTRDGVVTNDFTSAGTVKFTATGKGNYGGKVEKTFTIKQAESDVGTVTAETLENTLDVSQVVLSRTNQTLAGTLMLTDSTLKYGTNTYTWKFTPDNTNYKTVTGEVEVTVNDTAPPTGEISIGTNKWNSFLNTITFGQFFKKTEQVTITAQDNESGVASVSYYISDSGLTEEKVKELDNWTAGNTDKTTISISQKESCVVYAKITDNQGNMTYISSDGLLFDGTLPSITGVTDGKTYCTPQTVTVTDDNLETVTVNGKEQILSDGKFTLDVKFDTAAIVIAAEDKAGNVTKVTVNAGHSYGIEWKSDSDGHWQECAVCGDKSKVSAHTEDSGTVTKPATQTETGIRIYKCSVCGYEMRTEIIEKLSPSHKHSYGTEWKSDSNGHWHECGCGAKSDSGTHTEDGGTATKPATQTETGIRTYKCSVCGYKMRTEIIEKLPESHTHSYGTEWKSDSNNHWHECGCGAKSDSGTHTEDGGTVTKPATETEMGIRTYKCSVCGYKMRTAIIEKLPESHKHSYGTEWKSDSNNHWHECSCGEKSETAAHRWDSGTVTVQPTTDKEGEKTFTCTVCGKTKTETLGKLPPSHKHSYGTEWKSDSNNHWHECSCGEKSETAAHRWDSGTVTVQPTTDKEGEKTFTCTVCGRKKTETVKKLPSAGETGKEDVANNSVKLDSGISLKWKGKAIALKWAKVAGAEGYDVFAAQSGKKLNQKSPVKTVKNGKTSVSLTKIAGKKISGKKVYSVKIKAWKYADGKKIYTGSSRTYHIAGKENRKYTNAKKLKPAKKKYVLKKGRSFRIKVTIIKQSKKKKLPPKSYGPALQYRSGNEKIATVTQGGKVKAKKKGTCYIYVTALNGVRTKIKITVK